MVESLSLNLPDGIVQLVSGFDNAVVVIVLEGIGIEEFVEGSEEGVVGGLRLSGLESEGGSIVVGGG